MIDHASKPRTGFDLGIGEPDKVCRCLQSQLYHLIDLSLQLKVAHWNVRGSHFRSIHLQLDDIVDSVRDAFDDIAERIVTVGGEAKGGAAEIVSASSLSPLPDGPHYDEFIVEDICKKLTSVCKHGRAVLCEIESLDPVSADLLTGILGSLEKHAWMLRAQLAPRFDQE